jgi:hypothetical protein
VGDCVDELELDEPLELELDELLELEDGAAHDSVMPSTGSLIGSEIDESGVPGATLTVKFSLAPPSTVTVIVHSSAWAVGIAAMPIVRLAVAIATTSFRLLNNGAFLLPPHVIEPRRVRREKDATNCHLALQRRTVSW